MGSTKKKGEDLKRRNDALINSTDKKFKRQPLPMKLRALPTSFWQQPNLTGEIMESFYPSPLEDAEDSRPSTHSLVIGAPNTDLLFSLFNGLPTQEVDGRRQQVRRGRPKKNKNLGATKASAVEEDPYVTGVAAPEVKIQQEATAEGRNVLALMSLYRTQDDPSLQRKFSQRLQDLVVNL